MQNRLYTVKIGNDLYDLPLEKARELFSILGKNEIELLNSTPVRVGRNIEDVPNDEVDSFLQNNQNASLYTGFRIDYNTNLPPASSLIETRNSSRSDNLRWKDERDAQELERLNRKTTENVRKAFDRYDGDLVSFHSRLQAIEMMQQSEMERGLEMAENNPYSSAYGSGGLLVVAGVMGIGEMISKLWSGQDEMKFTQSDAMSSFIQGVSIDVQDDSNFFRKSFRGFLQSVPNTALMLGTGGALSKVGVAGRVASFGAIGVTSTGNKYLDLKHQYDIDRATVYANALLTGLAESTSEQLGTFTNFKRLGVTIGKLGKEPSRKIFLTELAKRMGQGFLEEGFEEFANTYFEYAIDSALIGDDREMNDVFQDAISAFVQGGMSALFLTPAFSTIDASGRWGRREIIRDSGIYADNKDFATQESRLKYIAQCYLSGKEVLNNESNRALLNSVVVLDSDNFNAMRQTNENMEKNSVYLKDKIDNVVYLYEMGMYQDKPLNAFRTIDKLLKQNKDYIIDTAYNEAIQIKDLMKERAIEDNKQSLKNQAKGLQESTNDLIRDINTTIAKLTQNKPQNASNSELNMIEYEINRYANLYNKQFANVPKSMEDVETRLKLFKAMNDLSILVGEVMQAKENYVQPQKDKLPRNVVANQNIDEQQTQWLNENPLPQEKPAVAGLNDNPLRDKSNPVFDDSNNKDFLYSQNDRNFMIKEIEHKEKELTENRKQIDNLQEKIKNTNKQIEKTEKAIAKSTDTAEKIGHQNRHKELETILQRQEERLSKLNQERNELIDDYNFYKNELNKEKSAEQPINPILAPTDEIEIREKNLPNEFKLETEIRELENDIRELKGDEQAQIDFIRTRNKDKAKGLDTGNDVRDGLKALRETQAVIKMLDKLLQDKKNELQEINDNKEKDNEQNKNTNTTRIRFEPTRLDKDKETTTKDIEEGRPAEPETRDEGGTLLRSNEGTDGGIRVPDTVDRPKDRGNDGDNGEGVGQVFDREHYRRVLGERISKSRTLRDMRDTSKRNERITSNNKNIKERNKELLTQLLNRLSELHDLITNLKNKTFELDKIVQDKTSELMSHSGYPREMSRNIDEVKESIEIIKKLSDKLRDGYADKYDIPDTQKQIDNEYTIILDFLDKMSNTNKEKFDLANEIIEAYTEQVAIDTEFCIAHTKSVLHDYTQIFFDRFVDKKANTTYNYDEIKSWQIKDDIEFGEIKNFKYRKLNESDITLFLKRSYHQFLGRRFSSVKNIKFVRNDDAFNEMIYSHSRDFIWDWGIDIIAFTHKDWEKTKKSRGLYLGMANSDDKIILLNDNQISKEKYSPAQTSIHELIHIIFGLQNDEYTQIYNLVKPTQEYKDYFDKHLKAVSQLYKRNKIDEEMTCRFFEYDDSMANIRKSLLSNFTINNNLTESETKIVELFKKAQEGILGVETNLEKISKKFGISFDVDNIQNIDYMSRLKDFEQFEKNLKIKAKEKEIEVCRDSINTWGNYYQRYLAELGNLNSNSNKQWIEDRTKNAKDKIEQYRKDLEVLLKELQELNNQLNGTENIIEQTKTPDDNKVNTAQSEATFTWDFLEPKVNQKEMKLLPKHEQKRIIPDEWKTKLNKDIKGYRKIVNEMSKDELMDTIRTNESILETIFYEYEINNQVERFFTKLKKQVNFEKDKFLDREKADENSKYYANIRLQELDNRIKSINEELNVNIPKERNSLLQLDMEDIMLDEAKIRDYNDRKQYLDRREKSLKDTLQMLENERDKYLGVIEGDINFETYLELSETEKRFIEADIKVRDKYKDNKEALLKYQRRIEFLDQWAGLTDEDKNRMKYIWAVEFDDFVANSTITGNMDTVYHYDVLLSVLENTDFFKKNKKWVKPFLSDNWGLSTLVMGMLHSSENKVLWANEIKKQIASKKDLSKKQVQEMNEKAFRLYSQAEADYLGHERLVSEAGRILAYRGITKYRNPVKEKALKEFNDQRKDALENTNDNNTDIVDPDIAYQPTLYDWVHTAQYISLLNWITTPLKSGLFTAWTGGELMGLTSLINPTMRKQINLDKKEWLATSVKEAGLVIKDAVLGSNEFQRAELLENVKFAISQQRFDLSQSNWFEKGYFNYAHKFVSMPLQLSDVLTKVFASNMFSHSLPVMLTNNPKFIKEYFGEQLTQKEAVERLKAEIKEDFRTGKKSPLKDFVKQWSEYAAMTHKPEGILGIGAEWYKNTQDKLYKEGIGGNKKYLFWHYTMTTLNPLLRITVNLVNSQLACVPVYSLYQANKKKKTGLQKVHEAIMNKNETQENAQKYIMELQEYIEVCENLNTNEARTELERLNSLVAVTNNILQEAIMTEQVTKTDADMRNKINFIRAWAGTMMGVLAFGLACLGLASGSGASYSDDERERLRTTGWRPNSFKFGETWISFSACPFIMLPITMGAELVEQYKNFKARGSESELFQRTTEMIGAMAMSITNLDIIGGNLNVVDMIINQRQHAFNRFLTSFTRPLPTQWAFARNMTDFLRPQQNAPKTLGELWKHENRVLFPESIPTRYNLFGDQIENRVYTHARGKSSVVGTIGYFFGVGVGYESIKDPELLSLTRSVIGIGERLPVTNGRLMITENRVQREMTWQEREKFFMYRGQEYSRLVKNNRNRIMNMIQDIENGNDRRRKELNALLQRLHRRANEHGRKSLEKSFKSRF